MQSQRPRCTYHAGSSPPLSVPGVGLTFSKRMCFNEIMEITTDFTRISIYVPKNKQSEHPLERLYAIAKKRDRSLNYMIVQAVLAYVEREEKKEKKRT